MLFCKNLHFWIKTKYLLFIFNLNPWGNGTVAVWLYPSFCVILYKKILIDCKRTAVNFITPRSSKTQNFRLFVALLPSNVVRVRKIRSADKAYAIFFQKRKKKTIRMQCNWWNVFKFSRQDMCSLNRFNLVAIWLQTYLVCGGALESPWDSQLDEGSVPVVTNYLCARRFLIFRFCTNKEKIIVRSMNTNHYYWDSGSNK